MRALMPQDRGHDWQLGTPNIAAMSNLVVPNKAPMS